MLEDILAMRTCLMLATGAVVALVGVSSAALTVAAVTIVARTVDTLGMVASGGALSAIGVAVAAVHVRERSSLLSR